MTGIVTTKQHRKLQNTALLKKHENRTVIHSRIPGVAMMIRAHTTCEIPVTAAVWKILKNPINSCDNSTKHKCFGDLSKITFVYLRRSHNLTLRILNFDTL